MEVTVTQMKSSEEHVTLLSEGEVLHSLPVSECLKIMIYVGIILCGLFLNTLVVVVFSKTLKKSTDLLTTCLAVCDMVNCGALSIEVVKLLRVLPTEQMDVLCVIQEYVTFTGTVTSGGLVVCVALDRYLRVRHPQTSLSRKYSCGLASVFLAAAAIVTLPYIAVHSSELRHDLSHRDHSNYASVDHLCFKSTARKSDINTMERSDPNVGSLNINLNGHLFLVVFIVIILACLLCCMVALTIIYSKLARVLSQKKIIRMSSQLVSATSSHEVSSVYSESDEESSPTPERRSSPPEPENRTVRASRVEFVDVPYGTVRGQTVHHQLTGSANTELHSTDLGSVPPPPQSCIKVKYENNATNGRRVSKTPSIASWSKTQRSSCRIVSMILIAVMLFLFYFPGFCLQLFLLVNRSTCEMLYADYHIVFEIVLRLNVVCFLGNPILYAFLTRGFLKRVKSCCSSQYRGHLRSASIY